MFTGLIQAIGKVVEFRPTRVRLATPWLLKKGESVSVDGVCLTVAARQGKIAVFDVGPETRRRTTLASLKTGGRVNLERALRVGDLLGGHWVTGHVEGTGRIVAIEKVKDAHWLNVDIPRSLRAAVLPKGSLAIDGISLTVAQVRRGRVRVMIVPHTGTHTTLLQKKVGDNVNLETDLLARYALSKRKKA